MSSALTVIVLGHAFFGKLSVPNTVPVQPDFTKAFGTTEIPSIIQSLTEPTTPTPESEARRPDYTYTPGIGAHKLNTQQVNWITARQICEDDGAHLVIINSVAEAEAVYRLVKSTGLPQGHVGVYDPHGEGQFVTIHDEALNQTGFTDWRVGNPSGTFHGIVENCVEIYYGKLNDVSCTDHLSNFVCELPRVELQVQSDSQHLQPLIATQI